MPIYIHVNGQRLLGSWTSTLRFCPQGSGSILRAQAGWEGYLFSGRGEEEAFGCFLLGSATLEIDDLSAVNSKSSGVKMGGLTTHLKCAQNLKQAGFLQESQLLSYLGNPFNDHRSKHRSKSPSLCEASLGTQKSPLVSHKTISEPLQDLLTLCNRIVTSYVSWTKSSSWIHGGSVSHVFCILQSRS